MSSATAPPPSLHSIPQETDNPVHRESSKFIVLTKDAPEEENNFSSPIIVSNRECSMSTITPCFKMTPPKSCNVLEPISEMSHLRDCHLRKSTPFHVGINYTVASDLSESSDEESSDGLVAKFPELLAIRDTAKLEIEKEKESSPDWFFSPKSCILMDPLDEKTKSATTTNCKESNILISLDLTQDSSIAASKPGKKIEIRNTNFWWLSLFCRTSESKVKTRREHTSLERARERILYGKKSRRKYTQGRQKELWTKFEAQSLFWVSS